MGVLNVTPDSFSDGGQFADPTAAIEAGLRLYRDGADIVDVGGESTRPGAEDVPVDEELARVLPVIEGMRARTDAPISIDTRKAGVMRAALDAGASMVNDVSALRHDPDSLAVVAESDAPVVLMHMRGDPATMQDRPVYDDVVDEVCAFLSTRLKACVAAGVSEARIWLDPGIGFGKTLSHNLALLRSTDRIVSLGRPVLVGPSRKRFIGALDDAPSPDQRDFGTVAACLECLDRGASALRVHHVAGLRQAIRVRDAIRGVAEIQEAR